MGQPPCQHRQTVRHPDLVLLHHFHQILNHIRQINISHIGSTVLRQQVSNVPIQLTLIRPPLELSQRHHHFQNQCHIIGRYTLYRLGDQILVPLGQPSHHPHVNPDNFPIPYPHITRMWIRMEKSVIHDLLDIIVHELRSYLLQIVSFFQKTLFFMDPKSINILHHQDMGRCIFFKKSRCPNKGDVLIFSGKLLHIGSFD